MTARRTRAAGAAALVAVALLAGCAPGGTTSAAGAAGAADAGYVAGDGSFATWSAAERGDPVAHTGTTYDGATVDLADWRGDVVVLNFWYAACPPCRAEAPDLRALAEDYADAGVHVLGVNPRDDVGAAQAFERTFEVPYPSLHDADAGAVAALEGVVPMQAMPSTVVLDRQGRVAARILGQLDPQVLRGLVDDVLAEEA
ncbi:TlpA family protein disulfide reductase [Georgenia sp. TF02-10]|uniref:TlpA family protein disulfide reductase n=1 Tax=Georgenia sp. TF02-10 TaxID=2917725 RepID=UPI001FA7A3F5|nr:TlpA disulfide reductase family protein [Georgenia sp. TF02-10]UNX54439.1 TlpA family protein disulfide reductase [Georgenia sp. TF02-10]